MKAMKRVSISFFALLVVLIAVTGCGSSSSSSSSSSNFTISGSARDMQTSAALPGLTVKALKATDNSAIASTTVRADGTYSLALPSGSTGYLQFSGTSNGTQYITTNSSIGTVTGNVTNADMPLVSRSSFGDPSGYAYLYLDALDQSGNPISGVSISLSPSLSFGYWNGTTYSGSLTATTSNSGSPSAFGYSTTAITVNATWTKSGFATYTAQYPLIVGEITYDFNNY